MPGLIYLAFAVPGAAFLVIYLTQLLRRKIKPQAETWFLITLTAALTVIVTDVGVRAVFHSGQPGDPWLLRGAAGLAAIMMWYQLYLLIRYQLTGSRRRQGHPRQD